MLLYIESEYYLFINSKKANEVNRASYNPSLNFSLLNTNESKRAVSFNSKHEAPIVTLCILYFLFDFCKGKCCLYCTLHKSFKATHLFKFKY